MKKESIKKYLRPQSIMGRKSTFSNAFASALAPHDPYSHEEIDAALRDLGQEPDGDLQCVYCSAPAATWDHVHNRVVKGDFSGHGHRVRNLVPCCRTCNERKGQKPWRDWLATVAPSDYAERVRRMEKFLGLPGASPLTQEQMMGHAGEELARYLEIRTQVFELLKEADQLAITIRQKSGFH